MKIPKPHRCSYHIPRCSSKHLCMQCWRDGVRAATADLAPPRLLLPKKNFEPAVEELIEGFSSGELKL